MNITLNKPLCIACGMCASVAPDIFSIDTGSVALKKDPASFSDADRTAAQDAHDMCPNSVITITE